MEELSYEQLLAENEKLRKSLEDAKKNSNKRKCDVCGKLKPVKDFYGRGYGIKNSTYEAAGKKCLECAAEEKVKLYYSNRHPDLLVRDLLDCRLRVKVISRILKAETDLRKEPDYIDPEEE